MAIGVMRSDCWRERYFLRSTWTVRLRQREQYLLRFNFAVLPLTDGEDGSHRSSIVWTERRGLAPAMTPLSLARRRLTRYGTKAPLSTSCNE